MRIPYRSSNDRFDLIDTEHKNPMKLFREWFEEAVKNENIYEANAMALATSTRSGIPSLRYVLLKELDEDGFHFFTNYTSHKARELDENPNASLLFYWEALKRQVRIEGVVSRVSSGESDTYFASRPKSSQIAAVISPQSQTIPDREYLDKKYAEKECEFKDKDKVPRPDTWGGYVLNPYSIEFWQGQTTRLHDRIRFRRPNPNIAELKEQFYKSEFTHPGDDGWFYERLAP